MGSIGDTFGLSVPSVGAAGPTYASTINSILTEAMLRLETRVPSGSLAAWSGAVDANNNRLDNVSGLGLYEQTAAPSGTPYGRLARHDGNLYYVDSSGAVQITAGANVNASGIGGIIGDYGGSDPAKVVFVGGDETYEFYDNYALGQWALVKSRGLSVIDEGGNACRILPHATQAAFDLFLPQNDPASGDSVLTLDSSGQMALAEASAGVTQFVVAAQELKHSNRTVWYGGGSVSSSSDRGDWYETEAGNIATEVSADGFRYPRTTAATSAEGVARTFPMPPVGQRLKEVVLRTTNPSGSTVTLAAYGVVDGTATLIGTTNSASVGTLTLTLSVTHTVVTNQALLVRVGWAGADPVTTINLYGVGVTWDYA